MVVVIFGRAMGKGGQEQSTRKFLRNFGQRKSWDVWLPAKVLGIAFPDIRALRFILAHMRTMHARVPQVAGARDLISQWGSKKKHTQTGAKAVLKKHIYTHT